MADYYAYVYAWKLYAYFFNMLTFSVSAYFGTDLEKKIFNSLFLSGLGAFFLFNLWNFVEVQQIVSD
jgi:hypothetical protein